MGRDDPALAGRLSLRLFLDTARRIPLVALFGPEGRVLDERTPPRVDEDRRGWALFMTLEAMLCEAGTSPAELEAVVVTLGPGPLSGTRVGLAVARALAAATGRPTIGLPSFVGLADPARAGRQTVRFPLDRGLIATADVVVDPAGWRVEDIRLLREAHELPAAEFSTAAFAAASAAASPTAADALRPIYLREPDTRPQTDGLGRPLAAGGAA